MKLQSLIIFIASAIFLFSCQKEFSSENALPSGNNGTAVFTFSDGTGDCVSALVVGSYAVASALTASNTVTFVVDVTTAGTYSLSTPVVNGISFSGSGTFASTGVQTVILTGSGTPIAAGDYDFKAGANSCTYSVTVDDNFSVSDSLYYDITVNAVQYKKVSSATSDYGFETFVDGTDSAVVNSGISWYTSPEPANATHFYLSKGFINNYPAATAADFKNFLSPGTYPYAVAGSFNGILIEWKDESGKIWKSNNAPATQTGSSFTINTTDEFTMLGVTFVRIYAEFSCTLYDDSSNSITITNGKYLGAFQQD